MNEEAKLLDELSAEVPEKQEGESGVEQTEAPTPEINPKSVVEALLFSSSSPLNARRLGEAADLDQAAIKQHIKELNHEYGRDGRAFHIIEVAGGFQFMTRAEYSPFIQKLVKTRASDKLTQAALETLAIIAYKQPIIRAEIESVRGVQSGQIVRNLLERRLIRVMGRDSRLGHPLLYGTSKRFLEVFGLKSLKDLPTIEELKAF